MEKTAKSLIGIDIGGHSLKAVKIEKGPKQVRILDFVIKEGIAKNADGKIDANIIKDALIQLGIEGAGIYSVVSGSDIVAKHSIVPFMPKEELRDAVRWSLKEVANFNLEESALDFKILRIITGTDGIKRNEVLAVAVHNALIEGHVKLLQEAGLELSLITVSHFALANLIARNEQELSGKTNALIDIGLKKTTILIFKGTTLHFIRNISTAGDSFTKALSGIVVTFPKKIELDAAKAEEIKRECGIPSKAEMGSSYKDIPLAQVSVLIRPVLERLLIDIRASFQYFREEFQVESIDQIFLSGGGARLKNLLDFIRDGLGGIPTRLVSLPTNVSCEVSEGKDLSGSLTTLAASIGVCLGKEDAINLLPTSVKIQKTIGIQQRVLQVVVPVLSVIMLLSFIWMRFQERRHQKILASYNDYYSSLVKLRTLRDNITKRQRFYNEIIGRELNLFVYLKELSRVVPKPIELQSLEFNKGELAFAISGFVYTSDVSAENSLATFLLDLESSPYFNNVILALSKKEDNSSLETISFSLGVRLSKVK